MKEYNKNSSQKYKAAWNNIKFANKYVISINKKLYFHKGITELIFPITSIVSVSAMATVTDIITQQQKERIGTMLLGICMMIISEFLLGNLVNILEAFGVMAEMDIQEACKTDLLKALKEKSLTEIEDPDVIDTFSMHMSKSIYSVSSSGLVIFKIITAVLSLMTAIIACLINRVNPLYFTVSVLPYVLLILPLIIRIEGKLKKNRNDSYYHLASVGRKQNKVESLFHNRDSIFDIKRRNITDSLIEKFTSLHSTNVEAHIETDKKQRKYVDKLAFISFIYTSLVHIAIYLLVVLGHISYGGAILLIACVIQFNQSFRNFIVEMKFLNDSMFLTNEYFDFVKKRNIISNASVGQMNNISLRNVSYQYKAYDGSNQYQLSNINLDINEGEKIAIVGKNGAGKTTLTKLIMGLYKPTLGECFINNIRYSDLDQNDILKLFSIATQGTTMYPLSLKENIIISDVENKKDDLYDMVCNSTGIKKIKECCGNDEVLLRKEIFEDAVDFSGGEKQKIKLARALYADRDIVVFDEPLSSLDVKSEQEFIDLIFNIYRNKTVIVITHNLSCTKLCDKIISMENGFIQEIGSHKQLIKSKGLYYELYIAQAKRYKEIENEKTQEYKNNNIEGY